MSIRVKCKDCTRPQIIICNHDYFDSETESDSESETELDSDDGSETEVESDSESLDDPKPYHGRGFRVYFDSVKDRRHFMRAFGFK
jgi:hypothetical protein